jgi:hypothetical protein
MKPEYPEKTIKKYKNTKRKHKIKQTENKIKQNETTTKNTYIPMSSQCFQYHVWFRKYKSVK